MGCDKMIKLIYVQYILIVFHFDYSAASLVAKHSTTKTIKKPETELAIHWKFM